MIDRTSTTLALAIGGGLLALPGCAAAGTAGVAGGGVVVAPAGKRVPAPVVAPVTIGGVRIEAMRLARERGFAQTGGVIEAFDAATGASLWTLQVYATAYDERLERDVQDVFITRMAPAGRGRLRIEDERGRRWIVDLAKRSATAD